MDAPNALTLTCPECGEDTLHHVLKGRVGSKEPLTMTATVQCSECGETYKTTVKEPRTLEVTVIVSDQGRSERRKVALEENETVMVGDRLLVDGLQVLVTSVESGDKRLEGADAGDIDTLWAKRFDRVKLRVSVSRKGKTLVKEVMAVPDEEFFVGDVLELKGRLRAAITGIRLEGRTIKRGGAAAGDIKRIYCRVVR